MVGKRSSFERRRHGRFLSDTTGSSAAADPVPSRGHQDLCRALCR